MRCMIFAALFAMAVSTASQAAQIYKWVDAQGVTHFDAQPPAGQQAEQVNVQKPPPAPPASGAAPSTNDSEEQRIIDGKVKKQVAGEAAKREENCTILRTNLAQLQNNPRVREQVEGGLKRLTDDERKARIEETNKAISDFCI
jgi:hypothetical protein